MTIGESGASPGPGNAIDHDRALFALITELTDEGMVYDLKGVLDMYGRERAARVVADGFAVIRRRRDVDAPGGLDGMNFVPTEDARIVVNHLRKKPWDSPDAYIILAGPWAALGPEDDPSLILRYAADDPQAVAEVRLRHAERRDRWEQKLSST
jgi:hypothetical protein